jgi:Asp-tRNA(Asn)/Glu-tRNA(Gln) amidotransferase A subunit family amidase
MTDICYSSLAELAKQIRTRAISPRELLEAHIQRIAEVQPHFNAFAHIDEIGARARAAAAEAAIRIGNSVGPLYGVPITVKSCIDVVDWPCAAGSLLRKEHRPVGDKYTGIPDGV